MFAQRHYTKELLDQDDIPFADILQNMRELNTINSLLGGHAITVSGFKQLVGDRKQIHICEIGCGGGDNLVAIVHYAQSINISLMITGIDIKQACIDVAASHPLLVNATFITSDYSKVVFNEKPDIVFSSLFCHHFREAELVTQFQWMNKNSSIGFFVNDLQRHWLAYYSIRILTQLFSRSYLVKNDAPLSVLRGFKQKELLAICKEAGIHAKVSWRWAFRYLILAKKHNHASI